MRFLYFLIALICLVGRNHFFFGTGLILGRWIFISFGIILLFYSIKRRAARRSQLLVAAALLLLVMEFGWNKLHEAKLIKGSYKTEVSLMSYNLFFRNASPKLSINKILKTEPDILLLQEITPKWSIILKESLGKTYPYKIIYANTGTHGIGIYSKYPVSKSRYLRNSSNLPFAHIVEVSVSSKKMMIINTHLASPAAAVEDPANFFSHFSSSYRGRAKQLSEIEQVVQLEGKRVDAQILVGDLNTTRYEPLYRELKSDWIDLFALKGEGWGFNFPNSHKTGAFLTIDYIMLRGNVAGSSIKVLEGGSSDHLALFGKISL